MKEIKRIIITAGGTGGHLYPAQALAQECSKQPNPINVLFVAGGLGTNKYFDRDSFLYFDVKAAPLISRNPLKCIKGMSTLLSGYFQSIRILKEYQPDAVVGFGSYHTVSALLAAKWLNIPIILHEANSVPGKANRWFSSFAKYIAVHFPSTAKFFKRKTIEVGLPLREGYRMEDVSKDEALNYFNLSSNQNVLLICGGSQGAKAINQLFKGCINLIKENRWQVIHLTGDASTTDHMTSLYRSFGIEAVVKTFEPNMQFAWSIADAFIGRAGAATIAEAMEFEVPGILIPYPHATDQHQDKNADFFVFDVKAGVKLTEKNLTSLELTNHINSLFENNQYYLFKYNLKQYKNRPNRTSLFELVKNINGQNIT